MNPWIKYPLLVLVGLALGLGVRAGVDQMMAPRVNVEAACWDALLTSRCNWNNETAGALAVKDLWTHRNEPEFTTTYLFNTTDVVASAYAAYANCVENYTR